VTWAISDKIFAHVKLHGNTNWNVADLVLLAVVWVWSGDAVRAVAVLVVATAIAAVALAPSAEPALKPNQPNHNIPVPSST
jgi:hypothetical protein